MGVVDEELVGDGSEGVVGLDNFLYEEDGDGWMNGFVEVEFGYGNGGIF